MMRQHGDPLSLLFDLVARLGGVAIASLLLVIVTACGGGPGNPVPPTPTAPTNPAVADGALPVMLSHEEGIPIGGVELGYGWDSQRGEVVPSRCIEFAPIRSTGQVASLTLREVADQSEVMSSLGISASVSINTMFASGSAQASFARDTKVSSTTTSLILNATVDNGVFFVGPKAPPYTHRPAFGEPEGATGAGAKLDFDRTNASANRVTLQPWAAKLTADPQRFRNSCGDSFVSSITSGAQLLATIRFSSSSREDKKQVSAAVAADFGVVQVKADARSASKSKLDNTSLDIRFIQVGGGSGILPTDKEALRQKLQELPIEAARDPKFHSMWVTPYESLPGWEGGPLTRDHGDDEIVADYYWFLTTLYRDIREIREAPARDYVQGVGFDRRGLNGFQDDVLALRSTLYEVMRAKRDGELPSPLPTAANLKALRGAANLLVPAPAVSTVESIEAWYRQFNEELREAIPFGDPNVLRLRLPIPRTQVPAVEVPGPADFARAAVDWYVRPQAERMCDLDPTDNECLSNAEMDDLVDWAVKTAPVD